MLGEPSGRLFDRAILPWGKVYVHLRIAPFDAPTKSFSGQGFSKIHGFAQAKHRAIGLTVWRSAADS